MPQRLVEGEHLMESQHTNDVRPALTPTRQVIKTVFAVLVSAVSIEDETYKIEK